MCATAVKRKTTKQAAVSKPAGERKKPDQREAREQKTLIEWAFMAHFYNMDNELCRVSDYLFAIPNGGHRHAAVAVELQKQGVKPGVSDLMLPVKTKDFSGLWVEMKAGKNGLSEEQASWFMKMHTQGYMCVMCVGYKAAADTIAGYVGGVYTKSGMPFKVY